MARQTVSDFYWLKTRPFPKLLRLPGPRYHAIYIHKLTSSSHGVGRNYRTPPATILTYFYRLVHIHTFDHTRTPGVSTMFTLLNCKLAFGSGSEAHNPKSVGFIRFFYKYILFLHNIYIIFFPSRCDGAMRHSGHQFEKDHCVRP